MIDQNCSECGRSKELATRGDVEQLRKDVASALRTMPADWDNPRITASTCFANAADRLAPAPKVELPTIEDWRARAAGPGKWPEGYYDRIVNLAKLIASGKAEITVKP